MNAKSLCIPFATGALLLSVCAGASAADSRTLEKCMAGASTTMAMVDCNTQETRQQDARLNSAYTSAMSALGGNRRKQLQAVQRLWIKYRDANCNFMGSATGASIDQVNGSACRLDMTRTRAQALENLLGP